MAAFFVGRPAQHNQRPLAAFFMETEMRVNPSAFDLMNLNIDPSMKGVFRPTPDGPRSAVPSLNGTLQGSNAPLAEGSWLSNFGEQQEPQGYFDNLLSGADDFIKDNPGMLAGIAQAGAQPGASVASTLAGGVQGMGKDRATARREELRQALILALEGAPGAKGAQGT